MKIFKLALAITIQLAKGLFAIWLIKSLTEKLKEENNV